MGINVHDLAMGGFDLGREGHFYAKAGDKLDINKNYLKLRWSGRKNLF